MKTQPRNLFWAAFTAALTLAFAAVAQESPKSNPPPPPPGAVDPAAPSTSPTAQPAATESTALRRLDVPNSAAPESAETEAAATPESSPAVESDKEAEASAVAEQPAQPPTEVKVHQRSGRHRNGGPGRVAFWSNATLGADETAEAVVSILGSSTSAGTSQAVVSVGGSSTSSGEVRDAVVSVLGGSRVNGGSVGNAVVSILGNTYVNAPVRGQVVTVLGNIELGPDADVQGDLVCVGGSVVRDPKATLHGQVTNITVGPHFANFDWLQAWVTKCLLMGRPLAFGAHLMWAWWLALAFLGFYVLLAVLFPRGVEKCVGTLENRPGKSILTAFLVTLITPAAAVLLAITIIGTPALMVSLFIAALFGKVVMLAWLGRRFTRLFGPGFAAPAFAVLVGGVVVLLLYTIPIIGFIVSKLIAWLGIGVVVYTVILGMKRNKPAPVAPPPVVVLPTAASNGLVSPESAGSAGAEIPAGVPLVATAAGVASMPIAVSAASLVRAGFWIRIAASLLDAIIIGLTLALFPHGWKPNFLLLYAVYCAVLWALRGTTVGGIICGLKIVRLDDRPLDWSTAIVRALGGFLSLVAAGLGFIWVAFDDQKQSWHDKIAGTTVVQVPKGVSLV